MFTIKESGLPCRYHDLIHSFGRPAQELCTISNTVLNWIYENYSQLRGTTSAFSSPAILQIYAKAISSETRIVLVLWTELCAVNFSKW